MDLGCLDLGCISVLDKHSNGDVSVDSDKKKDGDSNEPEVPSPSYKSAKNKSSKGTAVNRSYSQMKKPHRKSLSPLNWFPRKKVDSYLKRKIRLLQEVEGMTSTLDETLGDSNPHYSRVLREKIAAREAACTAMEARKAALVEASWCRILKASRIQSKEAEALLQESEKKVTEAFEAAAALGVIMYDRPDFPRKACEIESSSVNMGGSTTHTVTASFETPFEVDKEVAAAVKIAFIRLANCHSSFDKDEHKDLLRKISQNPDMDEVSESSSGCESDTQSQLESDCQVIKLQTGNAERQSKKSSTKLIDIMLERLKCLQEDELASLATIVATCGLNAALLEVENTKHHDTDFGTDCIMAPANAKHGQTKKEHVPELPSLDKFLVKHMSRLEREVQEAKNGRKNDSKEVSEEEKLETSENSRISTSETVSDFGSILVKHTSKFQKEIEVAKKTSGKEFEMKEMQVRKAQDNEQDLPSLDKFLVKHVSKLEREVEEARNRRKNDTVERTGTSTPVDFTFQDGKQEGKENIDSNKQANEEASNGMEQSKKEDTINAVANESESSLDSILVKPVHRLEREKKHALLGWEMEYQTSHNKKKHEWSDGSGCESLEKVLVKRVSNLEKAKMDFGLKGEEVGEIKPSRNRREERERELQEAWGGWSLGNSVRTRPSKLERDKASWVKEEEKKVGNTNADTKKCTESLDQVLVKHQSRLEREKHLASQKGIDEIKVPNSRQEARERELQAAWGGLSLGNSVRSHLSRLEQDKAAWTEAEEDERRRVEA
ncbi:hypothetical protein ACHQM5_024990 [Ranunculus cassubicifolius]